MKKAFLFVLSFAVISVGGAAAQQTRTVTNDDLDKYRQKRVAAERELRENYERLGFPSPAELDRQNAASRAERSALSQRLESENIEREQLKLERERAELEARSEFYQSPTRFNDNFYPNYLPNYYPGYNLNGFYGAPFGSYVNRHVNHRFNNKGFYFGYGTTPRIKYRSDSTVMTPRRPSRFTRIGR